MFGSAVGDDCTADGCQRRAVSETLAQKDETGVDAKNPRDGARVRRVEGILGS